MAPQNDTGTEFAPGDWAIDRGDEDESRVVVLDQLDVHAGDYVVPGQGVSIAEYNDVPRDDPVVDVVFVESLNRNWDAWGVDSVLALYGEGGLQERGVRSYAYPASRLRPLHQDQASTDN